MEAWGGVEKEGEMGYIWMMLIKGCLVWFLLRMPITGSGDLILSVTSYIC